MHFIEVILPAIRRAALSASHINGHILYDISSDEDRLRQWPPLPGTDQPTFQVLHGPPAPLLPTATKVQIMYHQRNYDAWQLLQVERINFFHLLLSAIPLQVQQQIPNFASITNARELFQTLVTFYGYLMQSDLQALYLQLQDPYNPADTIDQHLAKLDRIFNLHEHQGQAVPLSAKYNYLVQSLQNSAYAPMVHMYNMMQPLFTPRAYFELGNYLRNHKPSLPTVGTLAAAHQQTPAPTTTRPRGQQPLQKPTTPSPVHYCFTHALCHHTSKECDVKNRAPNHNENATFENQMGGKPVILKGRKFNKH